jgi:hypothetical protein
MTQEDVVTQLDRLVGDDATPLTDQAAVADRESGRPPAGRSGHDARRKRRVRADDAPGADRDVLLAEQRGNRETDRRLLTEPREAARTRASRADGGEMFEPLPRDLQHVTREQPETIGGTRHARA